MPQNTLFQHGFQKTSPSPLRVPPVDRRNPFSDGAPLAPVPFNIEDVVDEHPVPQEVAYVENEIPISNVQLTFQEKLNVINNPHLAERYKISASTMGRINRKRETIQKIVNQGHGDKYRWKPAQKYKKGMDETDAYMVELLDNGNAITKKMCMVKLASTCALTSASALEQRYRFFRRFYFYRWRRFGKMRCMVPGDLDLRIKRWHARVWWHHGVRNYKYGVFDDELCLVKEGAANGKTLMKGTGTQPKVVGEDEKGSVTVLLAAVVEFETGTVRPLAPTVLFASTAKNRYASTILKEVEALCRELGGIHVDITKSGWVTSESYKRWYHHHMPLDSSCPATIHIDDTYKGHVIDAADMPPNVDRHPIPGGATCAIQVHDKIINAIFLREYEDLLRDLLAKQHSATVTRRQLLTLVKQAHDVAWTNYGATFQKTAKTFVLDPCTTFPWEPPKNEKSVHVKRDASGTSSTAHRVVMMPRENDASIWTVPLPFDAELEDAPSCSRMRLRAQGA